MRLDPDLHFADDRAGATLDRARRAAAALATLDPWRGTPLPAEGAPIQPAGRGRSRRLGPDSREG